MKKIFSFVSLCFCLALSAQNAEAGINVERFRRAAQALTDGEKAEAPAASECGESEFKKGNECVPCTFALPNCLKCVSSESCSECAPGFERTQSGRCRKSGCDDVTVKGKRYSQVKINGRCSFPCKNGENCAACDTEGLCTECLEGYKLSSDKLTCYDCPEHCTACTGDVCTGCDDGYTLLEGRCFEGKIVCPEGTTQEENGCCRL